jgi:hypothetical protein
MKVKGFQLFRFERRGREERMIEVYVRFTLSGSA